MDRSPSMIAGVASRHQTTGGRSGRRHPLHRCRPPVPRPTRPLFRAIPYGRIWGQPAHLRCTEPLVEICMSLESSACEADLEVVEDDSRVGRFAWNPLTGDWSW